MGIRRPRNETRETPQGLIVSVRVKPDSSCFRLSKKGEELVLELTSTPRDGKANQEIMRELPELLGCGVRILRGSRSKKKLLLIKGMSREELDDVLDTC